MATAKPKVFKFPAAPGACADLAYTLQQERYQLQHQVDAVEEKEKALKKHILDHCLKGKLKSLGGKVGKVEKDTYNVPTIDDFDKFFAFVCKTKDSSLIQRRLGEAAVKERWAKKKTVPGVAPFQVTKLLISKAKPSKADQ